MLSTFIHSVQINFTKIVEALWQAMLRGEQALSMTDASSFDAEVREEKARMQREEGYTGDSDTLARRRVMARHNSSFIHPYM